MEINLYYKAKTCQNNTDIVLMMVMAWINKRTFITNLLISKNYIKFNRAEQWKEYIFNSNFLENCISIYCFSYGFKNKSQAQLFEKSISSTFSIMGN